jgi:type II secretory pathway predicted ATPase ExeA
MSKNLLQAQYGLKYNPFLPGIPDEDLWTPPDFGSFFFRLENIILDGGFAMITGDSGLGKSKDLQLISSKLKQIGDVLVGVMERPQSSLADFYRELGDLFGITLSISNRYGGFKALRAKWKAHISSTLFRPVLLIDEAQEMHTPCLSEIRLLGSSHFDSDCLLTTVLCGDNRLADRLRETALVPLGTRIKSRLVLSPLSEEELLELLNHLLKAAGAPNLMTEELKNTIVQHCAANPRILMNQGAELLDHAMRNDLLVLDEKLFFDTFGALKRAPIQKKKKPSRKGIKNEL